MVIIISSLIITGIIILSFLIIYRVVNDGGGNVQNNYVNNVIYENLFIEFSLLNHNNTPNSSFLISIDNNSQEISIEKNSLVFNIKTNTTYSFVLYFPVNILNFTQYINGTFIVESPNDNLVLSIDNLNREFFNLQSFQESNRTYKYELSISDDEGSLLMEIRIFRIVRSASNSIEDLETPIAL